MTEKKMRALERLDLIRTKLDQFRDMDAEEQYRILTEIKSGLEKEEMKDYKEFLQDEDVQQGDDGGDYVLVASLVRIAREHADFRGYDTEVVQAPQKENNWSATVVVKVKLGNQVWSGAADCRLGNAREGFHRYTTALAETRALGRALRRGLGINMCTVEEIRDRTGPLTPFQRQHIKVKFLDNELFSLDDVSKIVGRPVDKIELLLESEAADVIEKLTKKVNKKKLQGG